MPPAKSWNERWGLIPEVYRGVIIEKFECKCILMHISHSIPQKSNVGVWSDLQDMTPFLGGLRVALSWSLYNSFHLIQGSISSYWIWYQPFGGGEQKPKDEEPPATLGPPPRRHPPRKPGQLDRCLRNSWQNHKKSEVTMSKSSKRFKYVQVV